MSRRRCVPTAPRRQSGFAVEQTRNRILHQAFGVDAGKEQG
jgi:hypothetical protein